MKKSERVSPARISAGILLTLSEKLPYFADSDFSRDFKALTWEIALRC